MQPPDGADLEEARRKVSCNSGGTVSAPTFEPFRIRRGGRVTDWGARTPPVMSGLAPE